jgi:glycosyltransferase involved in cell wall biosynthesis
VDDERTVSATADERLDVLFGVLTLGTGGMERRCLLLADALVGRGWRVGIVTLKPWRERVDAVDERVRVFGVDASTRSLRGWVQFSRLIRRVRPAVYHGFGTLPGFPGAVLARLAGVPVVVNALVVSTVNYPRWFGPVGALCFAFTDHAVANSNAVRDDYVEHWRFPARKVTTIPNPVETRAWPFRDTLLRSQMRTELGLADRHVAIGLVARLVAQKGHKYLFDAFAQVSAAYPDAVLVLVGEGELLAELQAYARQLNIIERTRFLGLRHDVPRLLQAFDLFCFPSLFEGMPNVILEAMAAGLPVISTTVAGATELVVPGATGWLTPIADSTALAKALREALGDRDRLLTYGQAGRHRVEQDFDLPLIMRRYLDFYDRVMQPRD